jgi:hypothetical protein
LGHDALDLLERPGGGVDVRAPQLGGEEMAATEDVQRQVAIAVVVAVEEPALLIPMDRVVGGVEIENDLLRRRRRRRRRRLRVRVEKEVDEQPLDRRGIVADLVISWPIL